VVVVCERLAVGCCPPSDAVFLVPVALVGFDGDEVDGVVAELGWPAVAGLPWFPIEPCGQELPELAPEGTLFGLNLILGAALTAAGA